jgi:plastocyanin
MAVHHMKIKKDSFDPRSLTVKQGDQIKFQLHDRADHARVEVSKGQLFEGDNAFVVGFDGCEKTIRTTTTTETYRLSTRMSLSPEELSAYEQTGTVNGSIIVIP